MDEIKPHSITTCLALHLLPGVANFVFIYVVIVYLWPSGLPGVLAFSLLANLLCLMPIQLGILYYLAKKRGNKGWSLEGIVAYRQPINFLKYLIWVPAILLPTFIVFSVLEPVGNFLEPSFAAINISAAISYEGDFSNSLILITMVINIIFTAIFVPILSF